jgi:positive phototaxis protein PixI
MTSTAPIQTTQPDTTQQFLSFLPSSAAPAIRAMLPTQQLTEILSLSVNQIVPIPDVPAQVMGVCNWRGEVLWLIDLGALLGAEPFSQQAFRQSNYSAIVVRHQGYTVGLVVEQVSQMLWCNPAQIQPISIAQSPHFSPGLQGYWLTPQAETLLVLDGASLIHFFLTQTASNLTPVH